MTKFTTTLAVLFCTSTFLFAQYKIYGNVSNQVGDAVSFASVTLYNAETNKTITFKNTDSQGNYSLEVKEPGEYLIKVRNIKYDAFQEKITITADKKEYQLDFSLQSREDASLDEVIVKGKESLAKISGDTITFKIDRFTDKTERNLGDIINKLPGMEVDENGDIKANGEKVDKLLVEGKDFYSESQRMATQNLNADAVKDIQLLTDYKEDGKLDDMNAEKKTAVNVELKEGYKNKITGDVLVGSGYESKYDFHANLFKFNKLGNISFIGDVQNTGDAAFTFTDFMGFMGGFSEFVSQGRGRSFYINFGNSSIWSLTNSSNNVEKRNSQVGAFNVNQDLSPKWNLKFTSINSGAQSKAYSEQNRDYYLGQKEQVFNNQKNKGFFTSNRFKLKYKPSDSALVAYSLQFNFSTNLDRNSIDNILDGNPQNFIDNNDSDPYSIAQSLSYEFKPSKRTLMEFGASYDYQNNPNTNHVNSSQSYLGLPLNSEGIYDTNYKLNKISRNALLYSSFKYSRKKLIYNIELGAKSEDNNLESNWQDAQTKEEIEPENYAYDFKFNRSEVYSTLSLAKNKEFWQFDLGATLKYYTIKNDGQSTFSRFAVYPFASVSANFSTSNVLTLGYDYGENFPDVENYLPYDDYIINSYRNVVAGNEFIYNSSYFPNHNFNLGYNYFNQFSGFNVWANFRYSKSDGSIASYSQLNDDYNKIYNLIAPNSDSKNVFLGVGQRFKLGIPFKSRLRFNFNDSNGFSGYDLQSEKFYDSKSSGYGVGFTLETNMKPKFNAEIGFRFNESKTEVDNSNVPVQTYNNFSPYIELKGAYKESGIKWNTRFEPTKNQNIRLNIWDLDFTYGSPLSKWEYGVVGRNLLNFNNKEQVRVSQNNLYLLQNTYRILPGYFMLTAKLRF